MNKSIHFNPKYINYRDDILGIIRNFKTSNGQTIKEHRNTIRIFGLENFDINIKSFGRPNFINGLIYSYLKIFIVYDMTREAIINIYMNQNIF